MTNPLRASVGTHLVSLRTTPLDNIHVASHLQIVVLSAAQRSLINTTCGILSSSQRVYDPLLKNLRPTVHATSIFTTTPTSLSNLHTSSGWIVLVTVAGINGASAVVGVAFRPILIVGDGRQASTEQDSASAEAALDD